MHFGNTSRREEPDGGIRYVGISECLAWARVVSQRVWEQHKPTVQEGFHVNKGFPIKSSHMQLAGYAGSLGRWSRFCLRDELGVSRPVTNLGQCFARLSVGIPSLRPICAVLPRF